jgi:hypothetical protein
MSGIYVLATKEGKNMTALITNSFLPEETGFQTAGLAS